MTGTARICSIVTLFVLPITARAHRLDEYLQAARLALAPDQVLLKIDLTPGVDVAPAIFALINTDRDGLISEAEGKAYANRLLKDVVLEVDGQPRKLGVIRSQFPSFHEMQEGTGTIRIEARAAWRATRGHHLLFFRNNHQTDLGAYLVNALLPASPEIAITDQHRDSLQREIKLDIDVQSPPAAAGRPVAAVYDRRQFSHLRDSRRSQTAPTVDARLR